MKLQVKNLSWGKILSGVNLFVNKGELVGIVGPNGSGKSSLLRCIYRMNKPSTGEILLDDLDVWAINVKDVSKKLAVVPQSMPSEFEFTVREIVSMGRYPHKGLIESFNDRDNELISQALTQVGMLELADRNFMSLSGGEKQRALIARAFVQEAEILILDEPGNHLDIYYQLEIMNMISNPDITCLTVMHDLNLASNYCDRLYVMKDGEIYATGKPAEILTQKLIREVYQVNAAIRPGIFFSKLGCC